MKDAQYKIIYRYEHPIGSMLADTFTFGTIVACFWFNYHFINGNDVLDVLLFIVWLGFSVSKATNVKRLVEYAKQDLKTFESEDRRNNSI